MQKARRFMCPTESRSSTSNTTVRMPKKNRTSSAGGDGLAVSRTVGDGVGSKPKKPRTTRCSVRLLPGNLKGSRKAPKGSRASKPNLGGLQNAVVVAPFYTLKRCFQTKLVDLYSYEKMKKIKQKTKMAAKRNTSFEYDIIELKPLSSAVKKEVKTKKPKRKSRSASYCQCRKGDGKSAQSNPKQTGKTRGGEPSSPKAQCSSGRFRAKRRKLDLAAVASRSPKSELVPRLDFYGVDDRFPFSQEKMTSSAVGSRSKSDSWESHSNSPSCKEERVRGSFAISTTSFDSHLESFGKGSWDQVESGGECRRRMPTRRKPERADAGAIREPGTRHLVGHVQRRVSDEEIADFLDREPQTRVIPSSESNCNWQPLRRQSRTKGKKPENEEAPGYSLRSVSSGKKEPERRPASLSEDGQECGSLCPDAFDTSKTAQIEVGTQVDGNGVGVPGPSSSPSKTVQQDSTLDADVAPAESPGMVPPSFPLDSKLHPSQHGVQTPPREPPSQMECGEGEPHLPRVDIVEDQSGYFESELPEIGRRTPGEHSDLALMQVVDVQEPFQETADSGQPLNKESAYIFGARNGAKGFGESCEFPFGLQWVFSDDED